MVAQIIGVTQAPNFGKYLGLPSFVVRNKKASFVYIEDKIRQRIGSSIERVMNRYWWGSRNDRGIHWKECDRLCIPKKYGGLGFKDVRAFNLAMAIYYPKDTFIEACLGKNLSFCWRSIMAAKGLICNGVRRRIGNGLPYIIWEHPWLQDDQDPMIQTEMPPQLAGAKVVGLIDQGTGSWDQHILSDIFQPSDIPKILKIPISLEYDDVWY
ncbi:PREDICTED: uncharacterized protein LOC109172221 [Ipomoea nil]|uniref:uncharacterized protein LOC109172221 n=1 Tax=Ipomoea nil TaxID=35883 RepID=UPI0009009A8E|nr:PREDICTED: uncharacterized protein LOC109172221 [Ipomoea nil]